MIQSFLYSLFIRVYTAGISVYAFVNTKAKKWIQGRAKINKDIQLKKYPNQETIWFHSASVGEFEQGFPLLKKMRTLYPSYNYLITFFSPSGYEYVQKKYPEEWICYLPIDTNKEVTKFIEQVKPKMVFIIKYEFWIRLLHTLKKKNILVFLVSGIFRKEQIFFQTYGTYFRKALHCFTHFFVQDETSQNLLSSLDITNTSVMGDTRFDRVLENSSSPFADQKINEFIQDKKIFVAGNVWANDTGTLQKIISNLPTDWKIILAPHEVENYDATWLKENFCLYTESSAGADRILILNTIGILSKVYRYASFMYVGGGYGKGIHNLLEPAVYQKPILIGPKYQKFAEAMQLVENGCVFPVEEQKSLDNLLQSILEDASFTQAISNKMEAYIQSNTNISNKIIVYLQTQNWI